MKSLLYTTKSIIVPQSRFNNVSKLFFSRNYTDLNSFLTGLEKAHKTMDLKSIYQTCEDISLLRSHDINFKFETSLGYNVYKSDVVIQKAITSVSPVVSWNWQGFGIQSLINSSNILNRSIDPYLLRDSNHLSTKALVDKKLNTLQELMCASIMPKISSINSMDLNRSNIVVPMSKSNLTSNSCPDFICVAILENGITYKYYGDLKITNLMSFTQMVHGQHKNKQFSCNIYFVADMKPNHIFDQKTKLELLRHYNKARLMHLASQEYNSISLVKKSDSFLNEFAFKGDLISLNKIPLNGPKIYTGWHLLDNIN